MDDSGWTPYAFGGLLVLLSAFFAAAQAAFVSVNTIRLRKRAQEGCKSALCALGMADRYEQALLTAALGHLLAGGAAAALACLGIAFAHGFGAALRALPVILLALLPVVVLVPRALGHHYSERMALAASRPLLFFMWLFTPLRAVFNGVRRFTTFLSPPQETEPAVTEDDLHYLIGSMGDGDVLERQERELVQSALEFDEISIDEILTPRVNIVALEVCSTPEELRRTVLEEGYSRIPVFENSIDSVIGILYSRDYLCALVRGEAFDLRASLREPLFVHRSMRLSQMLAAFKAHKVNLAVVTDDYGGTLGIVTMEDVLEELVGDIWDEDDEIPVGCTRLANGGYEVSGDFGLDDLFVQLGLAPDEGGYATVNGWVLHLLEHIPSCGEQFAYAGRTFTVLEMNGHRIKKLGIAGNGNATEPEEQTLERI